MGLFCYIGFMKKSTTILLTLLVILSCNQVKDTKHESESSDSVISDSSVTRCFEEYKADSFHTHAIFHVEDSTFWDKNNPMDFIDLLKCKKWNIIIVLTKPNKDWFDTAYINQLQYYSTDSSHCPQIRSGSDEYGRFAKTSSSLIYKEVEYITECMRQKRFLLRYANGEIMRLNYPTE